MHVSTNQWVVATRVELGSHDMGCRMNDEREENRTEKALLQERHRNEVTQLQGERDRIQRNFEALNGQVQAAMTSIAEMHGLTKLSSDLSKPSQYSSLTILMPYNDCIKMYSATFFKIVFSD